MWEGGVGHCPAASMAQSSLRTTPVAKGVPTAVIYKWKWKERPTLGFPGTVNFK